MISRRHFLGSLAAAGLAATARAYVPPPSELCGGSAQGAAPPPSPRVLPPADVTLRIGRVAWEVAPGHTVATTAYNGAIPAPLIRLKEGVSVSVDLFNDTDHVEWVHWHGLSVPAAVDGTMEEGSLCVPAKGSRRYTLTPGPAGDRFVHSHAMAPGHALDGGLFTGQYGFVYVEPRENPGRYDREFFLTSHEWEPFLTTDEQEEIGSLVDPIQILREEEGLRTSLAHPGEPRESWEVGYNLCSMNGKALGCGEPLRVKAGERVLFHFLNASATETTLLSFPGHRFQVVALDGNPVPTPRSVEVLTLGVAERVSAFVDMNRPGVWVLGTPFDPYREAGQGIVVEYAGCAGEPQWIAPADTSWDYTLFGRAAAALPRPDEVIPMVIDWVPPGPDGFEHWTVNGRGFSLQDPPRVVHRGRRYRLSFLNRSAEEHALHLHRNTFELTQSSGRPTRGINKDVVVVWDYQSAEVDWIPDQPGLTFFHCHQQMHMHCGLAMLFDVV